MSDTTTILTVPGYGVAYRSTVWSMPSFAHYLNNDDRVAVTIWEEAHAENARRSTPVRPRSEEPDTYVWMVDVAWELAHAEQTVRNLRAEVGRLSAAVTALRTEQVRGNDPRLADFWAEAQRAAEDADYCEAFDNLAEELGGPRRQREFTFSVTLSVTIKTTDPDSIGRREIEQAIYGMPHGTLRDTIQGYDQID